MPGRAGAPTRREAFDGIDLPLAIVLEAGFTYTKGREIQSLIRDHLPQLTTNCRVFAKFDPMDLYLELKPFMEERIEHEKAIYELIEKSRKKK
jgi:hypothetical protein